MRCVDNYMMQLKQALSLFRAKPFDTSTEAGRSKERIRRAGITTVSAGAAKAVGMLAALVSVPLTFRYLGPERYGLWMVLVSFITAMGFADLGIGLGLVNAVSEANGRDDHELAREYVSSAFFMLLGIAAILAAAAIAAFPFLPWIRLFNVKSAAVAAEGARAFAVLYGWFVLSIPLGVVSRVQTGLQQGYIPQSVNAAGSLVTLLALLAVIALHGSLPWLVFGSTVGPLTATLASGVILYVQFPWLLPSWRARRNSAATKIFKLGLSFFVLQCAIALSYSSDNIVIAQVLGAASVAVYAVPQKLFGLVTQVLSIALNPLWPAYGEAIVRGDVSWVRKTFFGSFWATLVIAASSCVVLVLGGRWILRVFFGKALHAPLTLLIVLGIWTVVSAVSHAMSVLLNGAGVLKPQAAVAAVMSIVNLLLSIVLTRRFGVIGVCLGSIIAQLLIAVPVSGVLIRRLWPRLESARINANTLSNKALISGGGAI